jgi:hypothetical protein
VFPDEVIVMSQKRKDSANLKGEMTMITRALKLKKVPDAPLNLEDNNPTLVTPVKKMPVLYTMSFQPLMVICPILQNRTKRRISTLNIS